MSSIAWPLWPLLVVALCIILTAIHRAEKRPVWPFGELEAAPFFGDPTGYATRYVAAASQAGWQMLGWARHTGQAAFQVNYALMVSPGHETLAVIGTGKLFGRMDLKATWLWTPTADGRTFFSTDNQNGVQIDVSGNWRNQLAPATTFNSLLAQHQMWLRDLAVIAAQRFRAGREFSDLAEVRAEHFRAMERAGLIEYTDGSATYFHFTLLGAFKTATWSYLVGVSRGLTKGSFPRTA